VRDAFIGLLRTQLLEPTVVTTAPDGPGGERTRDRLVVLFRVRDTGGPAGSRSYDLRHHRKRSVFHVQETTLHAS
jgi:hypothetical protein